MNLPDFLVRDRHGHIQLAGHRIGLRHVVELVLEGRSAEQVQEQFPTLPLALIAAVVAYYVENRADVDAYIRRSREAVDRQASAPQPGPDAAELRRRTESRRPKESV